MTDTEDKILTENETQLLTAMGLGEDGAMTKDYVAYAGKKLAAENKGRASREQIIEALRTVSDPEIMINIWDMGLVYKIVQEDDGDVKIDMTVTAPICPVAGVLPQQAADAVAALDGVGLVEVKIVWEPAWSFENMTDEAKAMIELF